MDEVDAVAKTLAALAAPTVGRDLQAQRLDPAPVQVVAAVDGSSSVVLRGAGLVVGAARVGCVVVDGGTVRRLPGPLLLRIFDEGDPLGPARELLSTKGLVPAPAGRASGLDVFRESLEFLAACERISELPPGALLLLDGSLESPSLGPKAIEMLTGRARARGVSLAAVAKSTARRVQGVPLISAAWRLGEAKFPNISWRVAVSGFASGTSVTFVTKLHGTARHAFRVDAASVDDLSKLSSLSGDPAYVGYPYPLALAHNAALVTEEETEDSRRRIYEAARANGLSEPEWNLLFEDYHDVLELGA